MPYIDLYKDFRSLGRFDLPDHFTSDTRRIYRLGRAALGGGNGMVFQAHQMNGFRNVGDSCAIKLLRQLNTQRIDRFNNEVRVLSELDSQKISRYFDHGTVEASSSSDPECKEEIPWVAMQLGDQNMRQHVEKQGILSIEDLKRAAVDICEAVGHLHEKQFIHRDIKPDNFVWKNSRHEGLLMIDFGLAKRQGEDVSARPMDTFTQVKEFVGPVFFSSPELIEYAANKQHPVDYRSDIFQIGKLLWFLGTGKISAGVPSRRECPANGKLRELVIDMIDDDPGARPQSLTEVLERIKNI